MSKSYGQVMPTFLSQDVKDKLNGFLGIFTNSVISYTTADIKGCIPECIEISDKFHNSVFYPLYIKEHKKYDFLSYVEYISRYSFLCVDVTEININVHDYCKQSLCDLDVELEYYGNRLD